MTSPDQFTSRLSAAGTAVGADKPQLALTLAQSDLSHGEIQAVGGFAQAMQLATANKLALDSGAKTNYSATEQNSLTAINEPMPNQPAPKNVDSRSFLEKAADTVAGALSNTGSFLFHNPVSDALFTGMNWLGDLAHMPVRLLSDAVDSGNDAEINKEMLARGYDPTSTTSYLAFMFNQGQSQYHNLSSVRDTYGDDLVDAIIRQQADPAQFQADFEKMDPAAAADLQQKMQSTDWAKAYQAIDAQHISPGRDLARILTLGHTDNKAFELLSGALDAAYDWYSDPTLILGKSLRGIRAMDALGRVDPGASALTKLANKTVGAVPMLANRRAGLQVGVDQLADQAGIEALLRTDENGKAVTQVGKGWQSFLDQARAMRDAHAEAKAAATPEEKAAAEAKRTAIFRGIQQQYGSLAGLLDEVNGIRTVAEKTPGGTKIGGLARNTMDGGHAIVQGDPIENLDELSKYLVSNNGLLRLSGGMYAKGTVVMPGRLSLMAEQRAAIAGKRTARWIDYAKGGDIQPLPEEVNGLGEAGDAQNKLINRSVLTSVQAARARAELISRRFTTLIPNVDAIDLTDSSSSKLVEQVGRTYLNRGDSARLASAYALGDIADRRAIVRGVLQQSFHASGLSKSEAGKAFMAKYLGDEEALMTHQYGLNDTSLIDTTRGQVQGALYPDQLSTKVIIPSFREMNYAATKFAVGGFAGRTGLAHVRAMAQSDGMDKLMGTVKMGWITSAAGGLRNALDEVANFAANGMGRQVLQARSVFTQATADLRAQARSAAKEYQDLAKTTGSRDAADKALALRVGGSTKSYQDAQLGLEQAQKADMARANLIPNLNKRVVNGQQRLDEAIDYNKRALQDHEDAKAAGLPEDQLAPLRAKAQATADERVRAKQALEEHKKNLADPAKVAKIRQQMEDSFTRKGVVPVDEATANLKDAEAELKRARAVQSAIRYRIPLALRGLADTVNDNLIGVGLGKAMSVFGKDWKITPDHVKWASELTDMELARVLKDGVFQSHMGDDALIEASDQGAMSIHRAGLRARRYAYRSVPNGWGQIEPDGGAGLDAWAKHLQLRFADEKSPAHSWVQTMRALLPEAKAPLTAEEKVIAKAMGAEEDASTMPVDQWHDILKAARESVRNRVDDPDLEHFVNSAEVFHQVKGADKLPLATAKDDYADRVSADLLDSLGRMNPTTGIHEINPDLLNMLADGEVPDRSWLANNVDSAARPQHVVGQLWAPYNSLHELDKMPSGYTQMMTKAYDKVVTDQINALSRNPLMTALYMNARKNTLGYEKELVKAGWDQAGAEEVTKRIALAQAQDEAFKHIDNPHVSSQFSTIGRNYFAFVRAQEDWLRRWGRTIRDNPQLIRQGQLLIHGGTTTGMVEKDDQGNLNFVYPGSGLAMGLFGKLFGINGKPNGATQPVAGELTSQLTFLNPSLDNPLGFSGTPMISLPLHALTQFLGPDHVILSASLDKAVNGDLGAGRAWYENMLPSWANRLLGGVISTDPGSKFGAAYTGALANLDAAGALDDPSLQTASGKARFQNALSAQIHNHMLATLLFGFFAPAAPSYNGKAGADAAGHQGDTPDFSARMEGLRNLKDEARDVFAKLPFDQALAWWAAVHPNELIYQQGGGGARTVVGTKHAAAPATLAAAEWMQNNSEFMNKYGGRGGVGSFFIPQGAPGTTDGSYSDVAYRAQLELGLRDYKSLSDYFDDVVTNRGTKIYFDEKTKYDQALADAGQSTRLKKEAEDAWAAKKDEIYAGNPMLQQRFAQYAVDNAGVGGQLTQLHNLVADNSPATLAALGGSREGVAAMLSLYDQYQSAVAALGARQGAAAVKQRQDLKDTYQSTIVQLQAQFPDLADLARGVFRLP